MDEATGRTPFRCPACGVRLVAGAAHDAHCGMPLLYRTLGRERAARVLLARAHLATPITRALLQAALIACGYPAPAATVQGLVQRFHRRGWLRRVGEGQYLITADLLAYEQAERAGTVYLAKGPEDHA